MTNLPEKFIQALPGCHRSPLAGLYSYSRAGEVRLEFVILSELEEPLLVATRHPKEDRILFRDYPSLLWVVDSGVDPPVLYSRSGREPLEKLLPLPAKKNQAGLYETLVALGLAFLAGLVLFFAC